MRVGVMTVPRPSMKAPAGKVLPGAGLPGSGPSSHLVTGYPPLGGGQVGNGGRPGWPANGSTVLFMGFCSKMAEPYPAAHRTSSEAKPEAIGVGSGRLVAASSWERRCLAKDGPGSAAQWRYWLPAANRMDKDSGSGPVPG